jgi:hypothetical protein
VLGSPTRHPALVADLVRRRVAAIAMPGLFLASFDTFILL